MAWRRLDVGSARSPKPIDQSGNSRFSILLRHDNEYPGVPGIALDYRGQG
jgi:hypothetical protein